MKEETSISSDFSIIRLASNGDADALRALLAQGADVNQSAGGGQTALMRAAIFGHVHIVRLLVAAGADVRAQDKLGLTATDWATRRGFSEIAQLLSNVVRLETVTAPKSSPPEPARPKLEAERNRVAEPNPTPQPPAQAPSGTEQRVKPIGGPSSQGEHGRTFIPQPKVARQDDGLRWIKFHQRILADSERHKEQESLQSPATETTIGASRDAPGGQLSTEPVPEPRKEEEQTTSRTPSPVIVEIRGQEILEDSPQSVEADPGGHAEQVPRLETESESTLVEGKVSGPGRSNPLGIQLDDRNPDTQEKHPSNLPTPPATLASKTSASLNPPTTRCPQCNTTYRNPLLAYCAYDATKLVSADETKKVTADDTLFDSPVRTDWSRPTMWALVAVIAVLGGTLGYLINNYLSREVAPSAPVTAQSRQPENPRKNLPTIEGALSGMEVDVPEPEYPEQAKSEGVTGIIAVRVRVNRRGRVVSARSSNGDRRLRAAAVQAALKATFSEEKLAGRGANGTITYNFTL